MIKSTTVTFSAQKLIDDLRPIFKQCLIDSADDIVKGLTPVENFILPNSICRHSLAELWNDFLSESFFEENSDIEDILLEEGNQKIWIASRKFFS